ncbi:MAG TPA: FAD-dependent oxidoreductase [Chloroflexota bacterium]|nr:FAD-dependent oxidoreductase [Chloroflexota bacterium]
MTRCCIVGGGPAGVMLAYMLARTGIDTTLLEEHQDFDRDFRGDTIHPSVLRILDELGLAERVLQLRHTKLRDITLQSGDGPVKAVDFSQLRVKYPFVALIPQAIFLKFMADEASALPSFHLVMGASVRSLVRENGVVRGVQYRDHVGTHEVRALLTVAADGRFSRIRKLADAKANETSPPMDVLWFKISRRDTDPEGALGRFGQGHILAMLDRYEYWQVAYVIPKGTYRELHDAGLEDLRRNVAQLAPELSDRVGEIQDWHQISVLSVESDRLQRWYQPGLLFIGDAAHTMSPVGGVGINYAIQDAVVTANELAAPLRSGRMSLADLAGVQRKRELPTRIIQTIQSFLQTRILSATLRSRGPGTIPPILRALFNVPQIRVLPARVMGMGFVPVHVSDEIRGGGDGALADPPAV